MSQPKFSFNLGSTTTGTTGLFGATTSTPANTSTQPSIFGSTSTPAATGTTGFGGFGSTAAKPATTGTFGAAATTTTASPFGQTAGTSTGTTQPATNLFGQTTQAQTQPQASIFSFNKPATTTPVLGASTQPQSTSVLGNTTLNQTATAQQPSTLSDVDILTNALANASVYNDERDLILAKWNQLQAFYGNGKVFYQNSAIDITKDCRLSRFKSISYNCKPQYKNEDGLVCLTINQKEEQVRTNEKNITDVLHKTFNSDASLTVKIESIKSSEDGSKTELVFYVEQRLNPMTEEKQRVASTLVSAHLNKQEQAPSTGSFNLSSLKTTTSTKQHLDSIGVQSCCPLVGLTEEQIKKYLDTPPLGFNPVLWDTAKKNNPDSKKYLPVPIIGFNEINKRFKLQNQENLLQKNKLVQINNRIEQLNVENKLIKAKIEQMKTQNETLEQRILKIIINFEIRRKIGIPIQDQEKYLLNILDAFQIELNSPINKEIQRQKFSEFTENIKNIENSMRVKGKRQLEQQAANKLNELSNLGDIQKTLKDQQKAFKSLIDIINNDLKDINLIKNSF